MSFFLSVVTVLAAFAAAGAPHSDAAPGLASISGIQSTLQKLLRSIEDNGRDAAALLGQRQLWCDSAIHDFETANQVAGTSLLDMQAQLNETQAAVEEAKGKVTQLHVDIEMVQHTITQTDDMLGPPKTDVNRTNSSLMQKSVDANSNSLRALADNKRLSLQSLQNELEVSVPVLAQQQAAVAEMRQRISYRFESMSVAKDFVAALRDGCRKGADRAEKQAAARDGERSSIHVALQAVDQLAAPESPSNEKDDGSSALSFIEMADTTEEATVDDLSDLLSAGQADHSAGFAVVAERSARVQRRATKATLRAAAASSLRPRIQTLLTEIKHVGSAVDQAAFCSKQRASSRMAVKFAQDSVHQISSEVDAHTDAEAELSAELKRLQTLASAFTATAKTALEQARKEEALVQSRQKDQEVATQILDQAVTILKDLGMAEATKAVSSLTFAKKVLATQVQANAGFQQEASASAEVIQEKALAMTQTQEREQNNLEFARDDHASERLRLLENKRLYEADAQEATLYIQKLEESCKTNVESQATQLRSVQAHALEDADMALVGKPLEAKNTGNSLRGAEASQPKTMALNLTPMQRAAAEMGVSTD